MSRTRPAAGWLPYKTKAKRLETAWVEYRDAHAMHLLEFPDYVTGWGRPTLATAGAVWNLVAPAMRLQISDLLPNHRFLKGQMWDELDIAPQLMQALVVVLDSVIGLVPRDDDDDDGVSFYQNGIFDAIASRWSDHYRAAREKTPATFSTQMTRDTLLGAWQDLQLVGVDIEKLWKAVKRGVPGLYRVSRKGRQYRIDVDYDSKMYADFRRIIDSDPEYRPLTRRGRVLLANDSCDVDHGNRDVAAEWAYNIVEPGPRALNVIRILEGTRLIVSLEEVEAASKNESMSESSRRSLQLIAADITAAGKVEAATIKSGYYQLVNRRYQPAHFWPTEVTGDSAPPRLIDEERFIESSIRGGMFWVETGDDALPLEPLVGSDVRGSQWQILAELLGIDELRMLLAEESLKKIVARIAWDQANGFILPEGFTPDDPRLVASCKKVTTAIGYGGSPDEAARALGWQDKSGRSLRGEKLEEARRNYGPGLGDGDNIMRLLRDPRLHLGEILDTFLPAMKELAKVAHRDRYAGVVLTDPFDGARVRWNPISFQREADGHWPYVGSGPFKVLYKPPKGEANNGDYPVDLAELSRMVAPCSVHMLDSAFCGLVVEHLAAHGVKDIVAINDCWLVGQSHAAELERAIRESGKPWFLMLGPVYDDLERYLGDTKFGPWVCELRARWERRVEAEDWPVFQADDAKLYQLVDEADRVFAATKDLLPSSLDLGDPVVVYAVKEAIRHDYRAWLRRGMGPMKRAVDVARAAKRRRMN